MSAGYPAPLPSLDAAGALPWPVGSRTAFFGDEQVSVEPAVPAWATLAVRHTEREATSMSRRTFDVRGNVKVTVYTPLGRQSAEAYGLELATLIARGLDRNPRSVPRFSDGTPMYLPGSRVQELSLPQTGKWHRFAVEAPFQYYERR